MAHKAQYKNDYRFSLAGIFLAAAKNGDLMKSIKDLPLYGQAKESNRAV
jgi:hypothetical protein